VKVAVAARVVPGVRAAVAARVVPDVKAGIIVVVRAVPVVEGKEVQVGKAAVVRAAVIRGNPRQVVLPHPHNGVVAAGGDNLLNPASRPNHKW
jgi:hypothetical protein